MAQTDKRAVPQEAVARESWAHAGRAEAIVAPVTLADVDRLASMHDRALVGLREALAASGLDARFLGSLARVGERLDEPMRAPMRSWNARRLPGPAAILARIFVLHDPVTLDEAAGALGSWKPSLEAWVDAGLVETSAAGVTSRARLAFAGETVVFGRSPRTSAREKLNGGAAPSLSLSRRQPGARPSAPCFSASGWSGMTRVAGGIAG